MGRTARVIVAAAAAGLVTACTGSRPVDTLRPVDARSPASAPWVDSPAPAYTPPPEPTPSPQFTACPADSLQADHGGGGAAAGTYYLELELVNVSSDSCTLDAGPASVVGISDTGERATLATGSKWDTTYGPGPVNLNPGDHGWLTLSTADGCADILAGKHDSYARLAIVLNVGGEVDVHLEHPIDVICGLSASRFGAPYPFPEEQSPLDALSVQVHMPATIAAGSPVDYSVDLTNGSTSDVSLSPCPTYTESLFPPSASGIEQLTYYLSCSAVPSISAGETVTFDMHMEVPIATGPAKYGWQLNGSEVGTGGLTDIQSAG